MTMYHQVASWMQFFTLYQSARGMTTWGRLKKGNFTYAKERCLLSERGAKASHEGTLNLQHKAAGPTAGLLCV